MPVQTPVAIPTEEFDSVKKQPTNSCIIDDEDEHEELEYQSQSSFCCRVLLYLGLFLILGWFIGTLLVAGFGLFYQPEAISLYVDASQVKFGDEQVVIVEMIPEELQILVVNMTDSDGLPSDINPAFFGCMHALSNEVVGCVSQFVIPSFDECVALSSKETIDYDLTEPRAMETCGLATIQNGEFTLCSSADPVFISVWNLEDKYRTVELTYSFDSCQECNEIEGTCHYSSYYYTSLFLTYAIALLVCCCCVGCVCGCATTPSDHDDDDDEDMEEETMQICALFFLFFKKNQLNKSSTLFYFIIYRNIKTQKHINCTRKRNQGVYINSGLQYEHTRKLSEISFD
eukprot:TRINITY_DN8095_c0_g2_i1.p1 TRINITY_DN8095_c0_g2~~TRINITY_DN8095_c0_g2_i1.p1  ORF type:complete len:351 (+),score=41.92 TRINITY_DN8095_c0_g2_i1:24-1055(+)